MVLCQAQPPGQGLCFFPKQPYKVGFISPPIFQTKKLSIMEANGRSDVVSLCK